MSPSTCGAVSGLGHAPFPSWGHVGAGQNRLGPHSLPLWVQVRLGWSQIKPPSTQPHPLHFLLFLPGWFISLLFPQGQVKPPSLPAGSGSSWGASHPTLHSWMMPAAQALGAGPEPSSSLWSDQAPPSGPLEKKDRVPLLQRVVRKDVETVR